MVKGRGERRQRRNRILGFAGRPTDREVDEVIELFVRVAMRMTSRKDVLDLVDEAKARTFGGFGVA